MVGGGVGVEPGFRAIDRDFPKKACFRELVEGIVDCRQGQQDAGAGCLDIETFRRHMSMAAAKQQPTERNALARRTQARTPQGLPERMHRTAGHGV